MLTMVKLSESKAARMWTIKYYHKNGRPNYQYLTDLGSVLFRIKYDDFSLFHKVVFSKRSEEGLVDLFVCTDKDKFIGKLKELMEVKTVKGVE